MEGVRVNDPSVGEPKQIQTPCAWKKEKKRMKSLTGLLQRSFSSSETKFASMALIITVALFSLAAGSGDDNDQERGKHHAPQIEGTWLITVTQPQPGGPVHFPSLGTFSAGGGLVVTDSSGPPSSGNVYQGTWARTGNREVTFTFLGFQYDAAGVLASYIRVHEIVKFERSGNAYNSTLSTVEILDLNLNVVAGPFVSTTHGTRINAE